MGVQAVNGALSSLSVCMAYIADLLQPEHRAPAFGLVLCSYSLGILVGPLGGGYLPPAIASTAALAGMLFCILYVAALVPESTTERSRSEVGRSPLTFHTIFSLWIQANLQSVFDWFWKIIQILPLLGPHSGTRRLIKCF